MTKRKPKKQASATGYSVDVDFKTGRVDVIAFLGGPFTRLTIGASREEFLKVMREIELRVYNNENHING